MACYVELGHRAGEVLESNGSDDEPYRQPVMLSPKIKAKLRAENETYHSATSKAHAAAAALREIWGGDVEVAVDEDRLRRTTKRTCSEAGASLAQY